MSVLHESLLDRVLAPLGECLTPESARRLSALRADPDVQARIEELAEHANEGQLTAEESEEYDVAVRAGTILAIMKAKARRLLASTPPD